MSFSRSSNKRNSSFELLRIILIVCIMVEHANMWFISAVSDSDAEWLARSFVQSFCIGSVNAFVLISGWFGIRPRSNRVLSLLFQILVVTIPFLLYFIATGQLNLSQVMSLSGVYEYVFGGNNYWFVFCYAGLVIMAPVLNAAAESLSADTLKKVLCVSYAFILLFDFAFRANSTGISGGYSLIWFAFLYLLARYARKHSITTVVKRAWLLMTVCILAQTFLFWKDLIGMRYTNPLVLIPAVCAVSIFSKRHFYSRVINTMASAALMAYMLHMEPCIVASLRRFLTQAYNDYGYAAYMLKALGGIIALYLVAVAYNQIQSAVWRFLCRTASQSDNQ